MPPARNVWADGVWYGPDYPDAGDPPGDAVIAEKVNVERPAALDDVDYVGMELVTTAEQAEQFAEPAPVDAEDGAERETAEDRGVEVLDTPEQSVTTEGQAAAFRGETGEDEGNGDESPQTDGGPPAKAGPGSARGKWLDYARSRGVQVDDDASREDIIGACESAGVPTE